MLVHIVVVAVVFAAAAVVVVVVVVVAAAVVLVIVPIVAFVSGDGDGGVFISFVSGDGDGGVFISFVSGDGDGGVFISFVLLRSQLKNNFVLLEKLQTFWRKNKISPCFCDAGVIPLRLILRDTHPSTSKYSGQPCSDKVI